MSDGLGLIVDRDDDGLRPDIERQHQEILSRLAPTPVSFQVKDTSNLPPQWWLPIPPKNQGSFSCCVGGGKSGCFEHRNMVETGELVWFSMWQAYIDSQRASGFLGRDQGASLYGALESSNNRGCALDVLCPMPAHYTTDLPGAAVHDAIQHKHLGDVHYDGRSWSTMQDWLTNQDPMLFGGIWTSALDNINSSDWVIQPRHLKTGMRRGYHCKYLCGWFTLDGELCPVVRNTHGQRWGRNGIAVISHAAWDVYSADPNWVCLAFGDIQEREPKRRSYTESRAGDTC